MGDQHPQGFGPRGSIVGALAALTASLEKTTEICPDSCELNFLPGSVRVVWFRLVELGPLAKLHLPKAYSNEP